MHKLSIKTKFEWDSRHDFIELIGNDTEVKRSSSY